MSNNRHIDDVGAHNDEQEPQTSVRILAAPFQLKKDPMTCMMTADEPGGGANTPHHNPNQSGLGGGGVKDDDDEEIIAPYIDYRSHEFMELEDINALAHEVYCGPTPESNWVLPGVMLVGAYPASEDDMDTIELITSILKMGVTKFVCLQQEYDPDATEDMWRKGQSLRPYFKDVTAIVGCKDNILQPFFEGYQIVDMDSLSFDHCPIVDCEVTDDLVVINLSLKLVKAIAEGEVLYIHCWGGHGRTGTIVSIMLHLMYGLSADEAMHRCQAVHDLRQYEVVVGSPQTQVQRDQVTRVVAYFIRQALAQEEKKKEEEAEVALAAVAAAAASAAAQAEAAAAEAAAIEAVAAAENEKALRAAVLMARSREPNNLRVVVPRLDSSWARTQSLHSMMNNSFHLGGGGGGSSSSSSKPSTPQREQEGTTSPGNSGSSSSSSRSSNRHYRRPTTTLLASIYKPKSSIATTTTARSCPNMSLASFTSTSTSTSTATGVKSLTGARANAAAGTTRTGTSTTTTTTTTTSAAAAAAYEETEAEDGATTFTTPSLSFIQLMRTFSSQFRLNSGGSGFGSRDGFIGMRHVEDAEDSTGTGSDNDSNCSSNYGSLCNSPFVSFTGTPIDEKVAAIAGRGRERGGREGINLRKSLYASATAATAAVNNDNNNNNQQQDQQQNLPLPPFPTTKNNTSATSNDNDNTNDNSESVYSEVIDKQVNNEWGIDVDYDTAAAAAVAAPPSVAANDRGLVDASKATDTV